MKQIFQLCQRVYNLGDVVSPVITERLFDIPVHRVFGVDTDQYSDRPLLAGLGSMLANYGDLDLHVWGSGYEPGYVFRRYRENPGQRERWKIHALRGPHSAALLQSDANVVFGDPALLIPRIYTPKAQSHEPSRYFLHCENSGRDIALDMPITSTAQEAFHAIDLIVSSDFVFSEALHVAVIAQAFDIPWAWSFNRHTSGVFKWFDWFASIGIEPRSFNHRDVKNASKWAIQTRHDARPPSPEKLLEAFPKELL